MDVVTNARQHRGFSILHNQGTAQLFSLLGERAPRRRCEMSGRAAATRTTPDRRSRVSMHAVGAAIRESYSAALALIPFPNRDDTKSEFESTTATVDYRVIDGQCRDVMCVRTPQKQVVLQ